MLDFAGLRHGRLELSLCHHATEGAPDGEGYSCRRRQRAVLRVTGGAYAGRGTLPVQPFSQANLAAPLLRNDRKRPGGLAEEHDHGQNTEGPPRSFSNACARGNPPEPAHTGRLTQRFDNHNTTQETKPVLTETPRQSRHHSICTMTHIKRHRLRTVAVIGLTLLLFVAGASFACVQEGAGSVQQAEDCCQGHCQHAVEAEAATQCCQSHRASVSQALPAASPTKSVSLTADALPVAVISLAVVRTAKRSWVHLTTEERPPPPSSLYTLYCSLLI